jgi:hypothetical protein
MENRFLKGFPAVAGAAAKKQVASKFEKKKKHGC